MIELGLLLAAGLVFLLPAAILQGRRAAARRADAREQRRAAREAQQQAVRDEQQRVENLWRYHPDLAGLTEWLHFWHRRRGPLERDEAEANAYLKQREAEFGALVADRGGNERVSAGYRFLVLGALAMFPVVFCLGLALDFLIFRGLHPGKVLLPFGLASLAVLGIMIGSVLFLGTGRHQLVPASASDYAKLAFPVFGLLLVGGVVSYMTAIAPYRSAASGEQAINKQINILQAVETETPKATAQVITVDEQAVAQARASLKEAQLVDRLSAALLAVLEIPLTEGAVMGAELLAFDRARRRRDQAQQGVTDVTRDVNDAEADFNNRLMGAMAARGHDESVVYRIRLRIRNLHAAWMDQPPPGALPPGNGSGPGNGAVPPGPVAGGWPAAGVPAAGSATVPGTPTQPITTVDPDAGPSTLAPVVRLAQEESDLTG